MSNKWLTPYSGKKPDVTDTKAQITARRDDFAKRVEGLRKASGRIETRRMQFVCACTSGQFFATFERMNPNKQFRIARIEKEPPLTPAASHFAATQARDEQILDGDEFDTTGWHCAFCESRSQFVYCSCCGANVCRGRTKRLPNGEEDFRCRDGCKATGPLTPYGKIHAEEKPSGLATNFGLNSGKPGALPSRPGRPALPKNSAPRLGGPHR